jgi:hypothetical protein
MTSQPRRVKQATPLTLGLAVLSWLVAGGANAQTTAGHNAVPRPALVLVNAVARTADELSGTWVYSKDAHRVSFADMNASPPDPRNQRFRDINVQAEERRDPNLFFEFDMQRGPVVTLPGAWNTPHTEPRH